MSVVFFYFQIFKGYLDDQLNADGGWLETVVLNFHEGEGKGSQLTDDILKVILSFLIDTFLYSTKIVGLP